MKVQKRPLPADDPAPSPPSAPLSLLCIISSVSLGAACQPARFCISVLNDAGPEESELIPLCWASLRRHF